LAHEGVGEAAEARRWRDKAIAAAPAVGVPFSWESLERELTLAVWEREKK
jgi:hypothetical protein